MSGKKGMPRYSEEKKNKIIAEQMAGMSINELEHTELAAILSKAGVDCA
ncbi:hypothetical protein [uncultured Phascolarctobacterium sp.]|nr:hypothetical protein [uncultured Phascolarctobacterium sp.]